VQAYFQQREGVSTEHMLEEFLAYFQYLIRQEKTSLSEERTKLAEEKLKQVQAKKHQQDVFEAEKLQWEATRAKVEKLYEPAGNIIDLDIGGTHKLTTTRSTLCSARDSALAAMFSGRHQLSIHNGRVFIDRDGEAFSQVVQYLRNGKLPLFESKLKESAFFDELDYWQIPLDHHCGGNDSHEPQVFDINWCAPTLDLSADFKRLKKNDQQHGIVFCSRPLDFANPYVEFKVKIDTVFKGKSHLFVGLVDRSQYRPEFLSKRFFLQLLYSIHVLARRAEQHVLGRVEHQAHQDG